MDEEKNNQPLVLVKLIFRGLLPLVMLAGGVVLMVSRAISWNIVIGTPITVIGAVMLVFTYDEIMCRRIKPREKELTRCNVCARLTVRQPGVIPEDMICRHCQKEIGERLETDKKATGK